MEQAGPGRQRWRKEVGVGGTRKWRSRPKPRIRSKVESQKGGVMVVSWEEGPGGRALATEMAVETKVKPNRHGA